MSETEILAVWFEERIRLGDANAAVLKRLHELNKVVVGSWHDGEPLFELVLKARTAKA